MTIEKEERLFFDIAYKQKLYYLVGLDHYSFNNYCFPKIYLDFAEAVSR